MNDFYEHFIFRHKKLGLRIGIKGMSHKLKNFSQQKLEASKIYRNFLFLLYT